MDSESQSENSIDDSTGAINPGEILKNVATGVYSLTPRGEGRSKLWTIYSEIRKADGSLVNGVVFCKTCSRLMTYNSKSSSNLNRHRCYQRTCQKALVKKIQPDKASITPKSTPAAAPFEQQQYQKPPSDSELFDREWQKLTNHLTQSERKYEWLGEQVVTTLNDLRDEEIIDETIFAVQKLLHVAKSRHRNSNTDIQHSVSFPTCAPAEILESIVVKEEPELLSSQNTIEDSQFVAVRSSFESEFLNEFMEES